MTAQPLRVGVIGAGRLGTTLTAALLRAGYDVRAVAGRKGDPDASLAHRVPYTNDAGRIAEAADLVFVTVPDAAIRPVVEGIAWEPRHSVVHCSGALGLDALDAASRRGAAPGCLHPLQSFPSRSAEPGRFAGIYCGIEAAPPLSGVLEDLAGRLGANTFRLEGVDRALYHASAVMASNYVVALEAAATRLWALAGLPEAAGRPALGPLTVAAAENVARSELVDALTGPVARGDVGTVAAHLAALEQAPELAELYRRLGRELLRLPLAHGEETMRQLRELLAPRE